eukprot:6846044-Lingulodinium_polyedra.AAC.1
MSQPFKAEFRAVSMPEFACWSARVLQGIGIIEVCGGEGRPSQVRLRRRLKAGFNFDPRMP